MVRNNTTRIGYILLLFTFFLPHIHAGNNFEKKIEELLAKMTLEEKVGQMNQLNFEPGSNRMKDLIRKGEIGSVLNAMNPAELNEIQRIAVEESRLGIPLIVGRDVIHGFKTIFPIPLGQAASFEPELVELGARVAAIEASSTGINWTFAPMIDIARDPRWGRIAESCGEDTYLSSIMGAAMVKGFQGKSLDDPSSIAACAKHFVAYGAAEGGRDYNSTNIPERQLRNTYLPPFEAAAKAGSATFMTSFNDNDGIPSSGNEFILKQVLRNEWQFDGFVVSDWASISEMIAHGFCENEKEAAMKAANAGLDMEMVSYTYVKFLPELIREGKVKEEIIDNAVRNILRIKFRLGLFDNPYTDINKPSVMYAPDHLEAARKAAVESAILLKNNKTLPLTGKKKTILITGPLADAPHDQLGTWIFDGEKEHTVTPLQAFRQLKEQFNVIYEPGLAYSRDKNTEGIEKAVTASKNADIILIFAGEEAILSGEAHSLADLNLQGAQRQLIRSLAETGKPVVTVVMAGRPLTIKDELDLSDALLYCFHPGTMGGTAIAELITGKEIPSGKTPVTFPVVTGQIPVYYSHNNTGRPFVGNETLLYDIPLEASQTSLGNTSFYLDAGNAPLIPFGFGLSYTQFSYSGLRLSANRLQKNETLTVSFELQNTGNYEAKEVPQLYIRDDFGSVTRPVKELKQFKKISLKPGEKQTITFDLPISDLAFWNIDMKKVVEPGTFTLWVGPNSQQGESLKFEVY